MSLRGTMMLAFGLVACDPSTTDDSGATTDSGATPSETDGLAIVGTYVDAYGTDHTITESSWTQAYGDYPASVFAVVAWDNDAEYVIAQNDAENPYSPDAWSRFDWLDPGDGHLYYCQTAYDAADQQAAEATPRPDDSDPEGGGCGGFPWTDLQP